MPPQAALVPSKGGRLARPQPLSSILVTPTVRTVEDLKQLVRDYQRFGEFVFDVETRGGRRAREVDLKRNQCNSIELTVRTREGRRFVERGHRCAQIRGHIGGHTASRGARRNWSDEKNEEIKARAIKEGLPFFERSVQSAKDKPPLDTLTNKVWCISLAGPGRADVIPMGHPDKRHRQLKPEVAFDILAPLFFSDRLKINQNVGFDLLSIAKYYDWEIPPEPHADVMMLVFLLNENLRSCKACRRGGYNLDHLAEHYLGYKYVEKLGEEAYRVEWHRAMRYSWDDARVAWRLWEKISPVLTRHGNGKLAWLFDLEMDVLGVLMEMRCTGAYVDRQGFRALQPMLLQQQADLQDEIDQMAGYHINLNSPQQIGRYLYKEIGLPVPWKTEKNQDSTEADALKLLVRKHEAPRKILAYKDVSKLLSTYVEGFIPHIDKDNRVRTSFNQAVAKTGRLSSSSPNLQNIPARWREHTEGAMIRQLFVAPPGYVLIVADYGQIELRILAHQCKDEKLLYAFTHGLDLHRQTASLIYRVPPDEVTVEQRAIAKNSNFNFAFEGGPRRVMDMSGVSERQAIQVYENWHRAYPAVKKWGTWVKRQCWEREYVETMYGRKRRLKDIHSPEPRDRHYAERQAVNHPIQGTAADIAKLGLVAVRNALRGYDAHLTLQIHDEFVIECNEAQVDQVIPLIKTAMEDIRDLRDRPVLSVPLEVAIGVGMNWSEAK